MTALWLIAAIVVFAGLGASFLGWRARRDGVTSANLKADESTLRQVGVGNDVARKVDGLPDGAAGDELRKHWSR